MTSIFNLLCELSSFTPVSYEDMGRAKKSKITYMNNEDFARMVNGWQDGQYDEDPDQLVSELVDLLE